MDFVNCPEIKPCPFCRHKEVNIKISTTYTNCLGFSGLEQYTGRVECRHCGASGRGTKQFKNRQEAFSYAIEVWNFRLDEIIDKKEDNDEEVFPVTYNQLNGVKPGGFVLISTDTGGGKTSFMINLACNQVQSCKKVVYINLDERSSSIETKIYSRLFGLDYKDVKKDLSNRPLYISQRLSEMADKILIYSIPVCSSTNFILNIVKKEKPDVVIVDYVNLISPLSSSSVDSINRTRVINELHGIAHKYNCIIVSSAQLNRLEVSL